MRMTEDQKSVICELIKTTINCINDIKAKDKICDYKLEEALDDLKIIKYNLMEE